VIDDIRATITSDFKSVDNPVYIIGDTFDEMGGSILYDLLQLKGGIVPAVNLKTAKKTHMALYQSIKNGAVSACHDISEGGIAVSAIEMAIGGRCGFDFNLSQVTNTDCDFITALFSESASRYIVEVKDEEAFLKMMQDIPIHKIGYARKGDTMRFGFRGNSVHLDLKTAIKQWKRELI
ncbi:MAG: phosphoribosylformylglycinamidine synthase subunit PurL, partial [Proteobacteria bacterium]|nr:phosphoribosylformylglycinamidine synthase subunit PurL [Pseudomonadota bacterium]